MIFTHTHTHTAIVNLDIPIFTKLYDCYKTVSQLLVLFPKSKRYTLGQKIDQILLDTIELTITAGYTERAQKLLILKKASIKLDILKILIRLSFETKCINSKQYQFLSGQVVEIGRMLGGWIKAVKE